MIKGLHKKLLDLGLQYSKDSEKQLNPFFGYLKTSAELLFNLEINIENHVIKIIRIYCHGDPEPRRWKLEHMKYGSYMYDVKHIGEKTFLENIKDLKNVIFKDLKRIIFEIHGYDKSIEETQKQIWTFLLSSRDCFPKDVRVLIAKQMWKKRFYSIP